MLLFLILTNLFILKRDKQTQFEKWRRASSLNTGSSKATPMYAMITTLQSHHLQMLVDPWLKSMKFFPFSEAWSWKSPCWWVDFLYHCCGRAKRGEKVAPVAQMGPLGPCAGNVPQKDGAPRHPGDGHHQPAGTAADWIQVSASPATGKMKEMRNSRESTYVTRVWADIDVSREAWLEMVSPWYTKPYFSNYFGLVFGFYSFVCMLKYLKIICYKSN